MAASLRLFNALPRNRAIYAYAQHFNSNASQSTLQHARKLSVLMPSIQFHQQKLAGPKCLYSTANVEKEKTGGDVDKHEFQAETRMLLDIVARSLYSESEVFVRELISNASDALEKFRYVMNTAGDEQSQYEQVDRPLQILIETNKQESTLTIKDTGIGMTREELINNLGTIARSGSKKFLEELKESGATDSSSNIIGQFGVGFYSAFMVAEKVEVFTKSSKAGSVGLRWTSDGAGTFEISEVDGVDVGTSIVLHLKKDCREYADETKLKGVIKKYSSFVGHPVLLNNEQVNDLQPLWLMDPKNIEKEQYDEFYRFLTNSHQSPRFVIHYKADVPVDIRALLYIPSSAPGLFDMARQTEAGVSLYTRKVLIQSSVENLLPKWLRFVKGVVDSEDIPLNLSRELLQNSALISKINRVLTSRIVRHLQQCAKKEAVEYEQFYQGYGIFLKEGIITTFDASEREEIAKLLRFNSNRADNSSQRVSLSEYCERMPEDQKSIYYLAAPNRELAESSPYFEGLKKKNVEVLFCYEAYDELVLEKLKSFAGKDIVSVEREMRLDTQASDLTDLGEDSLQRSQINELTDWIQEHLAGKTASVKATTRLVEHPCVVTVENMAGARHFLRTQGNAIPDENRYAILQPQFDINPKHPIIKKLYELKGSNPELAILLVNQLFGNAMVAAQLLDGTQGLLSSFNELMTKALEKH